MGKTPHFVFLDVAHDVEEQINVGLVEYGETVEHDDLAVGLVGLVE